MANRGSGRGFLRDRRVLIAVILITAWIVGSVVARPFYDRLDDNDGDSPDAPAGRNYVELGPLVVNSTRIVVATFAREAAGDATTPTVRTFSVVETLKGVAPSSNALEVWGDPGPGAEGKVAPEPGKAYVLFLVERQVDGAARWSAPGEPSMAEVGDGGNLTFLVSERYANDMRQNGWTSGARRVPFEATLEEVRRLAGAPTPTATGAAP